MGILDMQPRNARQTARLRQVFVISVICLAIYCFLLAPEKSLDGSRWTNPEAYVNQRNWAHGKDNGGGNRRNALSPELLNNRFLTEDQCRATFPGLLAQVDDEAAKGPVYLRRSANDLGPLIARIRDGQLYILSATRKSDLSSDMLAHRSATLHQIANALLTWPRPPSSPPFSPFSHIPNTIFAFNHHDDPLPNTLSYSRPADPSLLVSEDGSPRRFFPVPHFSFYSWALPFIGSMSRAARAISEIESTLPFSEKIPKAVWRGTTWFNNPRAGRLRQNLVQAFGSKHTDPDSPNDKKKKKEKKPWADIEPLDWASGSEVRGERNASNALAIEDFCRYKYIIHTEGVTYSGRFQFHNLCASVVITPPVAWMQHVTHLLRPVFSYTLDPSAPDLDTTATPNKRGSPFRRSWFKRGDSSNSNSNNNNYYETTTSATVNKSPRGLPRTPIDVGDKLPGTLSPYPAQWVRSAWPTEHDAASSANIVFVAPDWSDLDATVTWLESHPRIAEGIARRQRALFHDGGYFSPAAEMCYWRGLISAWSTVVTLPDEGMFDDLDEVPWEEFSLKEIHK